MRLVDRALKHPWAWLAGWALVWALVHVKAHGWSWHFLVTGVHALFSSAPLSLYAVHPELQMGPLTFLVGAPFVVLLHGVPGEVLGMLVLMAAGLLVVREIKGATVDLGTGSRRTWFVVALLVIPAWSELAVHWGHVDDAGALLFGVMGLRLMRQERFVLGAVALAVAVDFKPWAVPFAALLLLAPARRWLPLGLVFVGVVLVAWGPFLLGDPRTLAALRFAIPIDPASTLHLLGTPGSSTPSWDRYAQLLGALALGVLAVFRKRWWAVFAIALAVRLLLDPATKNYYDVGIVAGAGILDIALTLWVLPWLTIGVFVLVYLPSYALADDSLVRSALRTVALVAVVVVAFVVPPGRERPAVQGRRARADARAAVPG